jgi:hypothetical protein
VLSPSLQLQIVFQSNLFAGISDVKKTNDDARTIRSHVAQRGCHQLMRRPILSAWLSVPVAISPS